MLAHSLSPKALHNRSSPPHPQPAATLHSSQPPRQFVPEEWQIEGSPTSRAAEHVRAFLSMTMGPQALPQHPQMTNEASGSHWVSDWVAAGGGHDSHPLEAEPAPAAPAAPAPAVGPQAVVSVAPGDGVAFVHINLPQFMRSAAAPAPAPAPAPARAVASPPQQQVVQSKGATAKGAEELTMSSVWRAAMRGQAGTLVGGGSQTGASTSSSATATPYASHGGAAAPAAGKHMSSSGGCVKGSSTAAQALRTLLACGVPLQPTLSQAVQAALALAEAEEAAQVAAEAPQHAQRGAAADSVNYYSLQHHIATAAARGAEVAAYYMTTDRVQPALQMHQGGGADKAKQAGKPHDGAKQVEQDVASTILNFLSSQQGAPDAGAANGAAAATPPPTQAFSRAQIVSALRASQGGGVAIPGAASAAAATARMSTGGQAAALPQQLAPCDSSTDLAVEGPQVVAAAMTAAMHKTKVETRTLPYELDAGQPAAAPQQSGADEAPAAAEDAEEAQWERSLSAAEAGEACCIERDIESGCQVVLKGDEGHQQQSEAAGAEEQQASTGNASKRSKRNKRRAALRVATDRVASSARLPDSPQSSSASLSAPPAGRSFLNRITKLAGAGKGGELMLFSPGPASASAEQHRHQLPIEPEAAQPAAPAQQPAGIDLESLLFDSALTPRARAERLAEVFRQSSSSVKGPRSDGSVGG